MTSRVYNQTAYLKRIYCTFVYAPKVWSINAWVLQTKHLEFLTGALVLIVYLCTFGCKCIKIGR